ncbi:hypothetical protein IW150_007527, partial [Coemansia sp. RSA 2607]
LASMPLLSFIRKFVAGTDEANDSTTEPTQSPVSPDAHTPVEKQPEAAKPPTQSARVPPPPPTSACVRLATRNAGSSSTLHTSSSRPSLARAESSASVYKDFTGTGHAENGHWNDPPAAVFRSAAAAAAGSGAASKTEGFTVVDGATTPNGTMVAEALEDVPETRGEQEEVVRRELKAALEVLEGSQASGKVLEDTR